MLTLDVPDDAFSRQKYIQRGYPDPLLPANHINPQVPLHVAQALTRAMALDPAQRQKSADEMRTMRLKIKPAAKEHQRQQTTKQLLPLATWPLATCHLPLATCYPQKLTEPKIERLI